MSDSHTVLEQGLIRLLKAFEAKYPGRPKNTTRYSSLPKDFAKAAFRRKYLSLKDKRIEENEHKDVIKEEVRAVENEDCTIVDLVNETDTLEKVQELTVNKRKSNDFDDTYVYDELFKPKKRSRTTEATSCIFDLHKSIPLTEVKRTFDPKGDGFCGFRAAAYLLKYVT
ncbi:hypothetical protein CU097_003959 [Rhizopus azygosporus]|uniref:Uncharacterized protein n=1 Tax=Rhizopus azygosporus TaxID=86630 RepID=A0A367J2Q4_RHIAZ|nr:hypothetical protein CU097_003959 [Rhizopus azygosporus]